MYIMEMKSTVRLVQSFCNVVRVKHLKCAKKKLWWSPKNFTLHCEGSFGIKLPPVGSDLYHCKTNFLSQSHCRILIMSRPL